MMKTDVLIPNPEEQGIMSKAESMNSQSHGIADARLSRIHRIT
jgi:hypothetical protein